MTDLPRCPSFRLDGQRALVAGASSGIGLAAAAALAGARAEVTLAARRVGRLRAAADSIRDQGGHAGVLELDVSDVAATEEAVGASGPYDILVNSAGMARHGPALEATAEDFDAVSQVNLRGAFFLARAVAQGLISADRPGSILTISSQMGQVGGLDRAVYCATKHAVEGFTKTMALEWGQHGIRVNTICPTFIRTELTEATFEDPERRAWLERKICLGRVGEVEDVMGAVVFLSSPAAALITGTALLVDGGWTAE